MRRLATILAPILLFAAGDARAILCAADPVPAATLLFPFLTAQYATGSTASDPVVDFTQPTTRFSVTNVTASPRIANFVLYNDFGTPVLGWNVLLTGYDVATYDFGRILEGYVEPTGPATNPATGRPYSPVGTTAYPAGPTPIGGTPSPLPVPGGVGAAANTTSSIFGLCTNPTYTAPYTVDPGAYAPRIPVYNRQYLWNGLRKSQVLAENQWWGNQSPYYVPPVWLTVRNTDEPVHGYVTVDVLNGCTFAFPDEPGYFNDHAPARTGAPYGGNAASGVTVAMGNSLLGDWWTAGGPAGADSFGESGTAVAIEADNQDVPNSPAYPRSIVNGASFHRYGDIVCGGMGQPDDLEDLCTDIYTGSGTGGDFTAAAQYAFGPGIPLPSNDFREPLPSAFAFRWRTGGGASTRIRVWKEMPDLYPFYGYTYVYSFMGYSYYAWDEEEHVSAGMCNWFYCAVENGQLPLMTQEVDVASLILPTSYMTSGWAAIAFTGSAGYLLTVPSGYTEPYPNTFGTQAWVEVSTTEAGQVTTIPATPLGNFLCDGLDVVSGPTGGLDASGTQY